MRYGALTEGLELLDRERLLRALAAGDVEGRACLPHGAAVALWSRAWQGDVPIRWTESQLSVPLDVLELAQTDPEGAVRLAATLPRPGAAWPPPKLVPPPVYGWVEVEIDLEAVARLVGLPDRAARAVAAVVRSQDLATDDEIKKQLTRIAAERGGQLPNQNATFDLLQGHFGERCPKRIVCRPIIANVAKRGPGRPPGR